MKNKICAVLYIATCLCLLGAALSGCQPCETCKEHESDVCMIKVCSLGDKDGESRVEHKIRKYAIGNEHIHIRTRDNERYAYNKNGWAIMLYKRSRRD